MTASGTIKHVGVGSALVAFLFLGSYCSELPKYRFERAATEVGHQLPGARLISSFKSGDLASPVSWFWPATTVWNYAIPDPIINGRFFTISFLYGETENPYVELIDVDCKDHNDIHYSLSEPDSALPALDLWGEPVKAPNGQVYRRMKKAYPLPKEWVHAFCETNWSVERKAAFTARERSTE